MNENKLHFVLLVPQDKPITNTDVAVKQAAQHMKAWCAWQMGNSKTFTPVFSTYQTKHPDKWYSQFDQGNCPYPERYWANAQLDARDYAGARFYMEHDSWVIYLDAFCDQAGGQHAGGASVNGSGICVLHSQDCAAIRGQDPRWTLCRGVGGGLHEALHTLGLPHPNPPPDPDWTSGVMGVGYMNYPKCILTVNDKVALNHSRFFAPDSSFARPPICPFGRNPLPAPRDTPLPVVRPLQTIAHPATDTVLVRDAAHGLNQ